jgi:hypothetical protein
MSSGPWAPLIPPVLVLAVLLFGNIHLSGLRSQPLLIGMPEQAVSRYPERVCTKCVIFAGWVEGKTCNEKDPGGNARDCSDCEEHLWNGTSQHLRGFLPGLWQRRLPFSGSCRPRPKCAPRNASTK